MILKNTHLVRIFLDTDWYLTEVREYYEGRITNNTVYVLYSPWKTMPFEQITEERFLKLKENLINHVTRENS